ncbi:MAG: TIR domain-containing protein [Candidatus Omnitrophota bacterium]
MPELHRYKIFISHAWKYNDDYYRLIEYLNKEPNFVYSNYSVPEHDPVDAGNNKKLAEELRQQIRPVEVVVILGGMYVAYSDWIQFEIDYAKQLRKPILGVSPWSATKMPQVIQDTANAICGWNTPTIVSEIRRLA